MCPLSGQGTSPGQGAEELRDPVLCSQGAACAGHLLGFCSAPLARSLRPRRGRAAGRLLLTPGWQRCLRAPPGTRSKGHEAIST